MSELKQRGGAREGAGRPRSFIKIKRLVFLVDEKYAEQLRTAIKKLIQDFKENLKK